MKKMFFGVAVAISAIFAASHAQCAENKTENLVKVGGEGRVAIVNVADVASAPLETAAKKVGNFLMIYCEVLKGTWTFSAHEKSCGAGAVSASGAAAAGAVCCCIGAGCSPGSVKSLSTPARI